MVEISRRALLGSTLLAAGVAAGAGLGLTRGVHHTVPVPPPPPPTALTDALDRQQRLLAAYDESHAAADTVLAGLRADVAAHGDALHALLELYPGWRLARRSPASPADGAPGSATTGPKAGSGGLAAICTRDAEFLRQAVLAWPASEANAGQVLPVLASIAACLSTQVQVLT